jgi:hypothetical protein
MKTQGRASSIPSKAQDGVVDSKALVHRCGFDRDRGAVVGAATSAARQGWWGSIAGWVRGRGAWPPEGAIPAARRVVWREGELPDPAARGRALRGLAALGLAHPASTNVRNSESW